MLVENDAPAPLPSADPAVPDPATVDTAPGTTSNVVVADGSSPPGVTEPSVARRTRVLPASAIHTPVPSDANACTLLNHTSAPIPSAKPCEPEPAATWNAPFD